jgi:hypothetical protein
MPWGEAFDLACRVLGQIQPTVQETIVTRVIREPLLVSATQTGIRSQGSNPECPATVASAISMLGWTVT